MNRTATILWLTLLCGAAMAATGDPPALRHGYTDDLYGQLHFSIAQPARGSDLPPIVLLHQSPNSSVEFDALVRALGRERIAIAIDTPGHGGSDGPAQVPTIEDYAAAIAEGLRHLGYGAGHPVDVFGYHTGSKVATELAIAEPRMIRRVTLSGIYDPPAAQLDQTLSQLHHPASIDELIGQLCGRLSQLREYYGKQGLSDEQWGRIRIDSLRAMFRQEYGHEAAYRYAPRFAQRMSLVTQPVMLMPMDDGLAQATREAVSRFRHATIEPDVFPAGGFFTQPDRIAAAMNRFGRGTSRTGEER